MEALTSHCVAQAPPNHSLFSHTVKNCPYTFLKDPPFVLFAIFDLPQSQTLPFLHHIRSSFRQTLSSSTPQFNSIFCKALHFDPDNLLPLNPPQGLPTRCL
ncbi:hypothetical protein E2542_SST01763 [Spatholobus suberectus]|nr:hypothetical protein E2542_SST01763 [Spatholobus suberectus]